MSAVLTPMESADLVLRQRQIDWERQQAAKQARFFKTTTASAAELGAKLAQCVSANADLWGVAVSEVANNHDETLVRLLLTKAIVEISREGTE